MTTLIPDIREWIEAGPITHLSTLNPDGSPHVTLDWIGLDGDDVVSGHLERHPELENMERDPRVVMTFEAPREQAIVDHGVYLVPYVRLKARATVEKSDRAGALVNRLARVYMDPDAEPASSVSGYVVRYSIERVGGVGYWGITAH
jgi:PPOX class probable F420-dependent enzyme